jgi:hypothetical protein
MKTRGLYFVAGKYFLSVELIRTEGGENMAITLDDLIAEGEVVRKECTQDGMVGKFVVGEKYELWISKCTIYLDKNKILKSLEDKFKEAAKGAAGSSDKHLDAMMGILKAIKEFE